MITELHDNGKVYTLEVYDTVTYCPIGREFEPIIRFELSHTYEGKKVILENESINLLCLEICKRNIESKMLYTNLPYLYYSFMDSYLDGYMKYEHLEEKENEI